MPLAPSRKFVAALLALGLAAPAVAESFASSASSASSASVGSLSDSISGSSNSSRAADKPVTAGDYRIADVIALAERPGRLRLGGRGDQPVDAATREIQEIHLPGRVLAERDDTVLRVVQFPMLRHLLAVVT